RLHAELRARRLLPDPARARERRDRAPPRPAALAAPAGAPRRARRAEAARRPLRAAPPARHAVAPPLARLLRPHRRDLPRPGRRRGRRRRTLAAALAVAALVCAAGVRRPGRPLRARVGRGPRVAGRLRGVRAGDGRSRAPPRGARRASHAPAARGARRAAAPDLRARVREPPASAPRVVVALRGEPYEVEAAHDAVRNRTLTHPFPVGAGADRARARPADDAGRRRLGVRAAVAGDPAAPARPGLLVARRRAAAARLGRRPRLRAARADDRPRPRGREGPVVQPPAEHVHWLFATGFLLLGLLLLAEAIVGREVWRLRPWRAYLWPSLFFALGVLMWPVMVFFTNSTIHMLAHSSWAQVMMLAGAAELG